MVRLLWQIARTYEAAVGLVLPFLVRLPRPNVPPKKGRGGARTPIPVASAEEIVRLLHALPGDSEFKRNAANVLVRYLGGDETLAAEVSENRAAQEQLAAENPDHPARIFGEAVESGEVLPRGEPGQLCQSIRNELTNNIFF